MVKAFVISLGVSVIAVFVAVIAVKRAVKLSKQNKVIANMYDTILRKERENEKNKQKLHTGSDVDNFNNSIDLLQNCSKRTES